MSHTSIPPPHPPNASTQAARPKRLRGWAAADQDVWALGVTLFNWLTGELPYWSDAGSEADLYDSIAGQPWALPASAAGRLSAGAVELLQLLLEKNPLARITLAGLRRHPWLTAAGAEPLPPPATRGAFELSAEDLAGAVVL